MKAHFGTPGVYSYPGFHTVIKKNKTQIGKGKAKPKFKMISPVAATDARMVVQAKANKKKKVTVKKASNKTNGF